MQELAFQVHYQYLLSKHGIEDALISAASHNVTISLSAAYHRRAELYRQMIELQNMYPEYYSNWLKEHEMRERKSRTNVVQ